MDRFKRIIEYAIKHNLFLQKIYRGLMSNVFKFIGFFIKVDDKLILFNGLGNGYNDSPKTIFEHIIKDKNYSDYKFVWALDKPEKYYIPKATKIKIDTPKYFITALRAKYWVSCVNIERGLTFKKKDTIYLNTWHGIPIKFVGNAVNNRKDFNYSNIDIFCYSGSYEKEIYKKDFNVKEESLFLSGLPRNDELYNVTTMKIKKIKTKLNLPEKKKVILYAPTWRDSVDYGRNYIIKPPLDINYLQNELRDEYVFLFRSHVISNKISGIKFNDFMRDVSLYPNINDLLIVSDILISDYSATILDFAILEKPIICFGYDYKQYAKDRGLYLNLEKELPSGVLTTQEEIITKIKTMDYEKECQKTAQLKKKFHEVGGNATEMCVKKLLDS